MNIVTAVAIGKRSPVVLPGRDAIPVCEMLHGRGMRVPRYLAARRDEYAAAAAGAAARYVDGVAFPHAMFVGMRLVPLVLVGVMT